MPNERSTEPGDACERGNGCEGTYVRPDTVRIQQTVRIQMHRVRISIKHACQIDTATVKPPISAAPQQTSQISGCYGPTLWPAACLLAATVLACGNVNEGPPTSAPDAPDNDVPMIDAPADVPVEVPPQKPTATATTSGGGTTASISHRLHAYLGAPSPAGTSTSSGYRFRSGLRMSDISRGSRQ